MKLLLILSILYLAAGSPLPEANPSGERQKRPIMIFDGETGTAYDYKTVASRLNQDLETVPVMKLDEDNQTPAEDRFGFWGPFAYSASFIYSPFWGGFGGPGFGGGFF